ncbi:MAG: thiamine-phosphate diphosphorylase [Dehalococcoidia bacterium]|nr:thiamine-phosphate diphosphorylase [Dehalococcoidia bacterium]
MHSLPVPCLCLVTDRKLCSSDSLEERVAAAVSGGVDMVQLREKDMPGGELLALALRLRSITQGKALLIINDRLDVALAAGADGLHLPQDSLSVRQARRVVPSRFLLGKSVHNPDSASLAAAEGADYLVLGTIFPTSSHPGAPTGGLSLISAVTRLVDTPVLVIGGVDSHNIASVIGAGAQGIAVVSAILGAPDPEQATLQLKQALVAVWKIWRATVER